MDKVNWSLVPLNLTYAAQDANGTWWVYETEPTPGEFEWLCSKGAESCVWSYAAANPNWKETLETRP